MILRFKNWRKILKSVNMSSAMQSFAAPHKHSLTEKQSDWDFVDYI